MLIVISLKNFKNKNKTMDKLLNIINGIIESKGETIISKIDKEDKLRDDIGLDSFDLAELTVRLEDEFNVDVFEDGLVETIGEIINKLSL